MIEFLCIMSIGFLAYLWSKPVKKGNTSLEELIQIAKTTVFVEVEQVDYNEQTIYLAFDIYTRKFLGQADNCIQLYNQIFESKTTAEVIWAKLESNEDTLVRIDKGLVAESIALIG